MATTIMTLVACVVVGFVWAAIRDKFGMRVCKR